MRYRLLLVLLGLVLIALPLAAEEPYRLDSGDVIAVEVWGHEDLHAEVTVAPDGRITLPLLGEISVRGATLAEIEAQVLAAYANYIKNPSVTVTLVKRRQISIKVFGQVNNPGSFLVYPDASIAELIAMAGGPTKRAALEKVQLLKAGDPAQAQLYPQGKNDKFGTGAVERGPQLAQGDVIFVPETRNINWETVLLFLGGILTIKQIFS